MANVLGPASKRVSTRAARRRTSIIIVITAFSLIGALVFAAVSADGREISRASSNDGGAWLLNRENAVVGHQNRAAGELSSYIRIPDSAGADVHQAGDLVVVHDPVTDRLVEIDTRAANEDLEPTLLPDATVVHAVADAIVITQAEPLAVWRVPSIELPTLQDLSGTPELQTGAGLGTMAVRADGTIIVLDHDSMALTWHYSTGTSSAPIATGLDPESEIVEATIVDGTAVLLLGNGDLVLVGATEVGPTIGWQDVGSMYAGLERLQQPSGSSTGLESEPAVSIAGISRAGELLEIGIDGDDRTITLRGTLDGTTPLQPIAYKGCVYAVVIEPAFLGAACDEYVQSALPGAGTELRLRLVNGWIWVNDLDDGGTWVTNDTLQIQSLNDWSRSAPTQQDEPEPLEEDGGEAAKSPDSVIVENPDALGEVEDSDDYNPDEENIPPEAEDDSARTRVDRAVVVDVLANDVDRNNDILIVTDVQLTAGDALVTMTASLQEVQVTPGPGFIGTIQFNYSISDGRSAQPVTATVIVDVLSTELSNRPPKAVTDVVATAPGNATTIDVLRNDVDPDGDALALVLINSESGTLRWDPSGQVTFTPDTTTSAGWVELPYIVADDLGAESPGLLRVEIRDRGSNQEPDARNDQATTVASRPVAIELLLNDSDPDGDPLTVSSRPQLLSSPGGADARTSTTSDGEFIFEADEPGTYLFEYTINDGAEGGSESDTARIRVEVAPADENDPPIAVRDDVVIAIGDTRTVYVLDNDGDPDGDVISIVDWSSSPGLLIAEFNDGTGHIGFQITATPTARRPTFTYSISDGVNEPVTAAVVVSLVGQGTLDQPPFAIDDVVEVRSGRTVQAVDVLSNDFDPEGGSLRIVRTGEVPDAAVLIAADGQTLAITVPTGARTSFTVPYDIEDEGGNRAAAVLRVQLISEDAPNRPPTARADEARTTEGDPIRIDVLRNDSDPDADAIALEGVIDQPEHGLATVTIDGAIQYQPDPLFTGTDIFRYAIVDAAGDRALGEVFVGVMDRLGVNLPPIANDDSYVLAGVPTTTPLEVRANDFDPEGDPLRVVDVTPATAGSVAIDLFGRVEYIPPLRLAVPTVVTFDYVIADTAGNRARATVSIELDAYDEAIRPTPPPFFEPEPTPEPTPTPDPLVPEPTPEPTPTPEPEAENLPPVAVNDERGPVPIGTDVRVRVLDNDFDPDGATSDLSIFSVTDGARISGRHIVIDDIQDTVQVEYTIADAQGAKSSAVVTVVVIDNQAPSVTPLTTETTFQTPIQLDLSDQAVDADGDELFFICCEDRRNGEVTAVVAEPNTLTLVFTPASGFVGQAAFSYRVDDQNGHQTSGVVTINVLAPSNRAPTVINNTVRAPQGTTVSVDLGQLSADPDGDPITRRLGTLPGGDISIDLDGDIATVTTTRDARIGPAGSFTYIASDGVLEAEGEITIEVIEGANTAPAVLSTSIDLPAAASAVVDVASLTTDNDFGDSVLWSLDLASHNPLVVSLVGSLVQIAAPPSAINTELAIAFTATDTRGETGHGTIAVRVVGPTEPDPAVVNDAAIANRGESVLIDALANDVDPLAAGLTIERVEASWGNASVFENQVRFSPGDRVGIAILSYDVVDAAQREASGTITVETVGVPDRPSPPGATADSRQVTIEWTNPAANGRPITGYVITSDSGAVQTVGLQNSYIWPGLINGEPYSFTVAAVNEIGQSLDSLPSLSVTPNQVPETPAPPRADFADRQLTVTWTAPTNEGSQITGYEIEIGPASAIEQVGSNTTFVWQGLTNGQDYTFRVRAKNSAGFSPFSALSAPEHPAARPEAPSIGATVLGTQSGSLTVNWTKPVDNGDRIIDYKIEAYTGNTLIGTNTVTGADTLSFDWSNLPNGTAVDFQVQARNRAGVSDWSHRSIGIPPCGVPGPATNVAAVRGDGQVQLSWDAAPTNGCPVTGYTITASSGGIQNSTTPGHTFKGLTNGTEYRFNVRATNIRGAGTASNDSNPVTPAGPPLCDSGSSLNASLSQPRQIDLNWTAALDNGSPVTEYLIDAGSTPLGTGSAATNRAITGLSNGTGYSFSYRASNVIGNSASCGSVSMTTWAVPSATGPTLEFNPVTELLTVTGFGGQSVDGAPKVGYTFTLDGGGGNPSNDSVSEPDVSPNNKTADFEILEDATYLVTVEACNVAGCVEGSDSILVVLATEPDEMDSSNILLNYQTMTTVNGALGTEVFVNLIAPNDNGAPITEYEWEAERIQNGPDEDIGPFFEPFGSASSTSFRVDFLGGHSDYRYSVNRGRSVTWRIRARAVNDEGTPDWSDWIEITPPTPAATVTAFEVSRNCQNLDSCVRVNVVGYGFTPSASYAGDIVADSGSRSTGCDGAGSASSSGAINEPSLDCNFAGGDEAPSSYWIEIDRVVSNNIN